MISLFLYALNIGAFFNSKVGTLIQLGGICLPDWKQYYIFNSICDNFWIIDHCGASQSLAAALGAPTLK